jgi:hypothetical protein
MSDFANLVAYVEALEGHAQPNAELMKIRPSFLPMTRHQLAEREKAEKEAEAAEAKAAAPERPAPAAAAAPKR